MAMLTPHFREEEMECPCCGKVEMSDHFMQMLEEARQICGFPFVVTSGFRCPKHNVQVGGSQFSSHLRGMAADLVCKDNHRRWAMIYALMKVGFQRFGIGKDFIHVDSDVELPSPRIWVWF